jgi:hypothetical protein
MSRERPGCVIAAAVLSIIYGTLFTICGCCGVAGFAVQGMANQGLFGAGNPQQAQMEKDLNEAMEKDAPGFRIVNACANVANLIEALALLGGGIFLFGMHPWARRTVLASALVAVLTTAANTIYQLVFVVPAMSNVMAAAMPKGPGPGPDMGKLLRAVMPVSAVLTALLWLMVIVYLLAIVVLLVLPHVRAAFSAETLPETHRRPRYDDADDAFEPYPPAGPQDDEGHIQEKPHW